MRVASAKRGRVAMMLNALLPCAQLFSKFHTFCRKGEFSKYFSSLVPTSELASNNSSMTPLSSPSLTRLAEEVFSLFFAALSKLFSRLFMVMSRTRFSVSDWALSLSCISSSRAAIMSSISCFSLGVSLLQRVRVYYLYGHDVEGGKDKQCLEGAEVLYPLAVDEVADHISRTVEKVYKGTSEAVVYVCKSSQYILQGIAEAVAGCLPALPATGTIVADVDCFAVAARAALFTVGGRLFASHQFEVERTQAYGIGMPPRVDEGGDAFGEKFPFLYDAP